MLKLQPHSLTPVDRFETGSCGLTLEERGGQVTFPLPTDGIELATGDWIMENDGPGAGTVWRVRTVETDYVSRTRNVTCEHIIQTLRDCAIFGEITPADMGGTETTVRALLAIQYALGRQAAGAQDWVLDTSTFAYDGEGTRVEAGYTFNGDPIFEAIETVCTTLEDCWWSYDLTVYPFRLRIARKATTATCEMRGGRNISTIRKTVDRSRMYTRIYPVGKDNLHITGDYLSKNESIYGVISRVETDQSKESEPLLRMWAQDRLNRHCEPSVTIRITGLELSQETGEPLDHLVIGTVCRVPMPEFGTTLNETITRMQWRDTRREPEVIDITLANEMEDVASIIRQEKESGISGKAGRAGAKKAGEDHAWFVDTTDHVAMVAEAIVGYTEEAVNWSRVAELTVDGLGIHGHVTQAEQDIIANQGAIEINERNIALTVKSRQIPNDRLHGYASRAAFPATGTSGHYYYYETGSGSSVKRFYFRWNGSEYIPANVITGLDGHLYGNYVNAGEIAVEINESGNTEAYIDAQKVILGQSKLTADDLESWAKDPTNNGNGVFAKYFYAKKVTAQSVEATDSLEVGGIVKADTGGWFGAAANDQYAWIYNGVVNAGKGVKINDGGTLEFSHGRNGSTIISTETAKGLIKKLALVSSGGNYDLLYVPASAASFAETPTYASHSGWQSAGTFSKATSLTGAWGSEQASAGKIYTITGTPAQNPALSHTIGFGGSPDMKLYLAGNGAPTAKATTGNDRKWIQAPLRIYYSSGSGDQAQEISVYTKTQDLNATPVYNNGWAAAQQNFSSKITLNGADPDTGQTDNEMVWIKYPNSSVDGSAVYRRYYLTADQDKAYIRLSSTSGTIVAEKAITPRTITVTETEYVTVTGPLTAYIVEQNSRADGTFPGGINLSIGKSMTHTKINVYVNGEYSDHIDITLV